MPEAAFCNHYTPPSPLLWAWRRGEPTHTWVHSETHLLNPWRHLWCYLHEQHCNNTEKNLTCAFRGWVNAFPNLPGYERVHLTFMPTVRVRAVCNGCRKQPRPWWTLKFIVVQTVYYPFLIRKSASLVPGTSGVHLRHIQDLSLASLQMLLRFSDRFIHLHIFMFNNITLVIS